MPGISEPAVSAAELPDWRGTGPRQAIAVFDNDGTLWTEQPVYAQKPSSIHRHVGQRPIMAAGNTDGDLAMLQWTAASPYRTLELVVHHTDGDREYAYDRDPILGSGTDQLLAAAAEHKWTVVDMAADWATVHPPA
jgi:hypothetical protein